MKTKHLNRYVSTVLVCLFLGLCGCQQKTETETVAQETEPPMPTLLYGVPVDSFTINQQTVKRGQMISQILTGAGLSYADAIKTYDVARPVYDFRAMKAGNTCYFFSEYDTTGIGQLRHFVYEISPISYVRVTFQDSIIVERCDIPVSLRQRAALATIKTSLWNALSDQKIDPQVALDLSDIFAWTVDFFGLGEGDRFAVLYEERVVEDSVVGTGNVLAALYVSSAGKKQYAFRHETDSTSGYYDLQGNSMRRAFLKAPLHFSRISSRFSNGRLHPILKKRRPHHGVDYAAPAGTPVVAIGDGRVIAKGYDKKGGGNYVKVRHNSVYTSVYMHLQGFAKGLKKGSNLRQGELLGYVGSTGLATGPHLDFRMYREGHPIDPLKVDMPPAEPMDNDEILSFMEESDRLKASLDSVLVN